MPKLQITDYLEDYETMMVDSFKNYINLNLMPLIWNSCLNDSSQVEAYVCDFLKRELLLNTFIVCI